MHSGTIIVFHAFLWALILHRRSIAIRDGWGSSPLVQLVMRDGAWMFAGICCEYLGHRQNISIEYVLASYISRHSSILLSCHCSFPALFVSDIAYTI